MIRRIVDPGRLLRALALEVENVGSNTYEITGGQQPHTVQTDNVPWVCDCADAVYRPGMCCKHVAATYLTRQLAAPVRHALRTTLGTS